VSVASEKIVARWTTWNDRLKTYL